NGAHHVLAGGEAVSMAVYILNRSPTQNLGGSTTLPQSVMGLGYKTLEHILGSGNARVQNDMGLVEELLAAIGDEPATTEEALLGWSLTPADWWWEYISELISFKTEMKKFDWESKAPSQDHLAAVKHLLRY
ncbi:hypothetical protein ACJX0J_013979, partial [Zea mays]